uniref:Uncharacterized protein n=1 Tax=Vitis vinifera TaxID=29760 RepID=A5B374_VITVI|nr:hypothetical protein VITISV_006515 [Vitis vinifera]
MAGASSSKGQKSGTGPPKKKAKGKAIPLRALFRHSHIQTSARTQGFFQFAIERRGVLLEALFRISKGYFFGPHHLIMAVLLYFEEKILEHLGYPAKPQLERRRICREIFTLDRWTSMIAYGANQGAPTGPEHPDQPEEPIEIPVDTPPLAPVVASTEHIPEVAPSASQATPPTPPVIPPIFEPSPSSEPRITISIIEYRGLCHTFQALATSQSILT